MTTYTRFEVDPQTGEQRLIEMSEYEFRCARLGMPAGTPEDVVNAAWAAHAAQMAADQNAQTVAEQVLAGAVARLSTYNPQVVLDLLPKIEDPETRQVLSLMNALIADLRLLLTTLVR